MAPECDSTLPPKELAEGLSKLALALKPELPANTFCIRFDPAMDFEETSNRNEYVQNFRRTNDSFSVKKALTDVQPPDTTVLSLTDGTNKRSDEELLGGMKSKWRYNIKLASKKGVTVEKYNFNKDYELFSFLLLFLLENFLIHSCSNASFTVILSSGFFVRSLFMKSIPS